MIQINERVHIRVAGNTKYSKMKEAKQNSKPLPEDPMNTKNSQEIFISKKKNVPEI